MATEADLRAAFALLEHDAPRNLPSDSTVVTNLRWGDDVPSSNGAHGHSGTRRLWSSRPWLALASAAIVVGIVVLAGALSARPGRQGVTGSGAQHPSTRGSSSVGVPCRDQKCPTSSPDLDPLLLIDGHVVGNSPYAVHESRRVALVVRFKGRQPQLNLIESINMTVSEYSGAHPTPIRTRLTTTRSGLTLTGLWTVQRIAPASAAVAVNVDIVYESTPGTTGGAEASYSPAQLHILP